MQETQDVVVCKLDTMGVNMNPLFVGKWMFEFNKKKRTSKTLHFKRRSEDEGARFHEILRNFKNLQDFNLSPQLKQKSNKNFFSFFFTTNNRLQTK